MAKTDVATPDQIVVDVSPRPAAQPKAKPSAPKPSKKTKG